MNIELNSLITSHMLYPADRTTTAPSLREETSPYQTLIGFNIPAIRSRHIFMDTKFKFGCIGYDCMIASFSIDSYH